MGYDEDRDSVHTDLEQAAAESKEAAEAKVQENQKNREPDYEDDAQNLGRSLGLTGSAAIATPRDAEGAAYQSPRHTGTGEWATPNSGGGGAKTSKSRAKSEAAESSS
jgi:hypothetical protein